MTMSFDAAGNEAMENAINAMEKVARYLMLCMDAEEKLEKEAAILLSLSNEQGALEKELKELVDVLPAKQERLDEIMERKEFCAHRCNRLETFRRKNILVMEAVLEKVSTTIPAAAASLPCRVSETAVAAGANQEVQHDHGGSNQHMYQEDASCTSMRELIEQWTAEEVANASRMTPSKLKRRLRAMNVVDTLTTNSTKLELVQAWVKQVVHRRTVDYYGTRATTEHQAEAFAGSAVAADATEARTAVLPPAVSAALPPPFDYSNITNMPTANEHRPSAAAAAAAAEEVATVDAFSPPCDPYADMPPLMLAEDPPPKNGIWLLTPASSSSGNRHDDRVVLHYAFARASRVKSVQRGFFAKGSVILSAMEGVCWIYAPVSSNSTSQSSPGVAAAARAMSSTTSTSNHSWEIFAVRDINLTVQLFTFEWPGAEAANLVVDGRGAAYVLLPTDPSNASTCDRILIRINSQYEKGKCILQQFVPCHSHLYRDRAGGVWIHVPDHTQGGNSSGVTTCVNDSERLSPGIWYITPFEATCVVRHLSPHAKINLDGSRTGLLLLCPMEDDDNGDDDDSCFLVHVGPSGELHRRIIPVAFSRVAAVLDDGKRGVLVHCRNSDNRWKLYRCPWEEMNEETGEANQVAEVTDCPGRNTKLVTDGKGGVWVWKKVGKRNNRAISYISRDGELIENVETFPGGSIMEG